jgi:hypothetical protein
MESYFSGFDIYASWRTKTVWDLQWDSLSFAGFCEFRISQVSAGWSLCFSMRASI